jgi:DNA-binding FadR family transcriptional regulator
MPQSSRHARLIAKLKTSRAEAPPERGNDGAYVERNVYAYIAHKVGSEIVAGDFPPGTLLPNEAEMRSRFAVSRTALREAYSVLAAKGLILPRPKIGTRVRPKADWNMLDPEVLTWHLEAVPNEEFISELYTLRHMIEPAAAALAAVAPSQATIEQIGAAFADMVRCKDGEGDLISADLRYHLGILNATGNHFLGAFGSLIYAALFSTFKLSWEGAARIRDERLQQHGAVFEAIRDKKPELARKRMDALLTDSLGDVREFLRQRDERARRDESNGKTAKS